MKLVIAEKPSVAISIAKVIGATSKKMDIMKVTDIKYHGVLVIWCKWQIQINMMKNMQSGI